MGSKMNATRKPACLRTAKITLLLIVLLCGLGSPLPAAQAAPFDEFWSDDFYYPGLDGGVAVILLDGSGNLFIGGSFTTAGDVVANHLARWDGSRWSDVGGGMDGSVSALAVDGSGNLYAGGYFTTAGGVGASNIARWDGAHWSALGSGTDSFYGGVSALALDGSGNLYAGGGFITAGGASTYGIARWDGANWSALGSGLNWGAEVFDLAEDGSGNLYAAGSFTTAGGISVNNIARWDGSQWSSMGNGLNDSIYALAVDGSGNLYAGGNFIASGEASANYIARWDGSAWNPLDSSVNWTVYDLAVDGSGNLYVGGEFTTAGGLAANGIARWDGANWNSLGSGLGGNGNGGWPNALALDGSGNLYAGGYFSTAGGVSARNIARWDGSSWSAFHFAPGNGMDGRIFDLALDGSGNLYAGGEFTTAGGVSAQNISRWDGNNWNAFGDGLFGDIFALAVDSNGNLYAANSFWDSGRWNPVSDIERWDGSGWSLLGETTYGCVTAMVVDSSGNLYIGGWFINEGGDIPSYIARWDGTSWNALGSGVNGQVNALALDSSGNLYVGGDFTTAGGASASHVARWDGANWTALGNAAGNKVDSGLDGSVNALALDGSGGLYAGGNFTTICAAGANQIIAAHGIAHWDGSEWSNVGGELDGTVNALALDGSGRLYVGGTFSTAGGACMGRVVTVNHIARWDGRNWSALGGGMNDAVNALAVDANDDLYAGGAFTTAGGKASHDIAAWKPRYSFFFLPAISSPAQ
jgi:hypothetical protein